MQVRSIRRELRLLRYYALGMTLLSGLFLLGAVHEARRNASFDTLTVNRIDVVDREGKLAMTITNHDDFPPPIINGKTFKRNGGSNSNGIVFYNQQGSEQGALDWSGVKHSDGTYESGNTLSYDSVTTDQLLQVNDGNANGKTYAYMIGWNRSRFDTPEVVSLIDQIESAKTLAEQRAIIAKHPNAFHSATRFLFGYDDTNTAQVLLNDGDGHPRIKMFVTAAGQSELQFLDAKGNVVAKLPK